MIFLFASSGVLRWTIVHLVGSKGALSSLLGHTMQGGE